jgi:uncharacterized phage protein (TIGR02218 family)
MEYVNESVRKEVTTFAICWRLCLRNGKVMGFTSHDEDIWISEECYCAHGGFTASAITSSGNLSVDNLDVEGVLDHESIKEEDILSGLYDHAEICVFLVDYLNPCVNVIKLRKGWLGEIKFGKSSFVAEVRGLLQAFTAKIGDLYSPICRAKFGDFRCKIDSSKFKIKDLYIAKIEDDKNFTFCDANYKEQDFAEFLERQVNEQVGGELKKCASFSNGILEFQDGANVGLSVEIKYQDGFYICLKTSLPNRIKVGDKFSMITGCDKTFDACCGVYHNGVNFRGEPHIPNPQNILRNVR